MEQVLLRGRGIPDVPGSERGVQPSGRNGNTGKSFRPTWGRNDPEPACNEKFQSQQPTKADTDLRRRVLFPSQGGQKLQGSTASADLVIDGDGVNVQLLGREATGIAALREGNGFCR